MQPGSDEIGMVAAGGNVPLGYYKDPEKSARTFKVIDGVRYSFPGDLATVNEDGLINLLGRGSQVINTGGEKVYPEEVEEAVKRVDGVDDCLVVGVPTSASERPSPRSSPSSAGADDRRGVDHRRGEAAAGPLQGAEARGVRRAGAPGAQRQGRLPHRPPTGHQHRLMGPVVGPPSASVVAADPPQAVRARRPMPPAHAIPAVGPPPSQPPAGGRLWGADLAALPPARSELLLG